MPADEAPPVDQAELRDLCDERYMHRLLAAYADAVTRGATAELSALFLPDARLSVVKDAGDTDEAVGPSGVGELIGGYLHRYDFLIQAVLNARFRLRYRGDPDRAVGRVYIAEYRQVTDGGRRRESAGVYHDEYRRRDGRWWFAHRHYARLYVTAPRDLEPHPFPTDYVGEEAWH